MRFKNYIAVKQVFVLSMPPSAKPRFLAYLFHNLDQMYWVSYALLLAVNAKWKTEDCSYGLDLSYNYSIWI